MRRKRMHVIVDTGFVFISILIAFVILKTGAVHTLIVPFQEWEYLGNFLAGSLFTSAFTTAPAIVVLGELSQNNSLVSVVLLGGLGAALGDYIIFKFIKDRVAEDIRFLLGYSKLKQIPLLFSTRISRWVMPMIGAIIIVSPLPDELGLTILGMSKMSDKVFLPLAFCLNAAGILVVGLVARATMW